MKCLRKLVPRVSIRDVLLHFSTILTLDVLLLYFLRPVHPIPCFFFAAIVWALTVEDYRTQLVDLRLVGAAAALGVLMRPDAVREIFFLSCLGFFLPHLLQEMSAKVVPIREEGEQARFHFESSHPAFTEDNAPPYLPCFIVGLAVSLAYYLLVLPIPSVFANVETTVLLSLSDVLKNPWFLFGIPVALFLLSLGFYLRNRYALQHQKNVVYRGLGDGDIYFLGMLTGAVGPFLVLAALVISLIPSSVQVWLMERGMRGGKNAV